MNSLNGVLRNYVILLVNNMMTIISVTSLVAYITFRSKLIWVLRLGSLTIAIGTTTYLIITYHKLGQIHDTSIKCISSWKRYGGGLGSSFDRVLVKKYVKSLRSCRLELGDFGYYRKSNSSRIISKLIFYTTKGIIIIKKFV